MEKRSLFRFSAIAANPVTANSRKDFSCGRRCAFCRMLLKAKIAARLLVPTILLALLVCCRQNPGASRAASDAKTLAVARATQFLFSQQRPDGAFLKAADEGEDSAVASTGYALLALKRAQSLIPIPEEPLTKGQAFLAAKQGADSFWRYKPFLPADLDDTAAAIGALARATALEQKRTTSIRQVFALQKRDGSLPTWLILPENGNAPPTAGQKDFSDKGEAEVMAFFLSNVGNAAEFQTSIAAAEKFILRAQRPDGLFASTWYRNPLYATFRVQQFLAHRKSQSQASDRARKLAARGARTYLTRLAQEKNFQSNLDLAFALLILQQGGEKICPGYAKYLQKVLRSQNADGSWPAEPLFLTEIGQKNRSAQERRFIASSIYTTALVLEILVELDCPSEL